MTGEQDEQSISWPVTNNADAALRAKLHAKGSPPQHLAGSMQDHGPLTPVLMAKVGAPAGGVIFPLLRSAMLKKAQVGR